MLQTTESNFNLTADTDPGYGQLLAILIRRRFWLGGVLFIVICISAILTFIAKPTYESSMELLVEPNYQGKNNSNANSQTEFADSNVQIDNATQLNLMRSSQLLQKAVDLLQPQYPDLTVKKLKEDLIVTQLQESKVNTKIFQATYTENDPIKTQTVLKTIQKVYQDYNLEQQKLRLAKGLSFIDSQLPSARESTAKTETELAQFRKSQNLIQPDLQAEALINSLKDIDQELRTVRAQYRDSQARYTALQQQVALSPKEAVVSSRLSESSRYQALLNEIQKTELELEQQRQRFTDSYPAVQNLIEQQQKLLVLLQQEKQRVDGRNSASIPSGNLLNQGQLGKLDVNLAGKLLEEQTNILGLKARADSLEKKQYEIRAQLKLFPALLAEYSRLEPEVKLKRDNLEQLLKARQELSLEIARGGFDWQVVEEPQLGLKTGPKMKRNLLLGAVLGLMLGGIAAFIREMVDDAVHTSDDLKKQTDLPLLGITPELPSSEKTGQIIHLPFRQQPILTASMMQVINWPLFRESLDLIYQNIHLINSASMLKSIVITSALAGEGKTTLALGLAMSAARLHQRVLLIDADLRRPSLHKHLNLPNEQGLSTLLASNLPARGENGIEVTLQNTNISVLTSGPTPLDPAQLLSSQKMKELIAAFEQNYDLVLLDAPPVLGMVDAILTASFCSGVVMVGRIGQVTRSEITQATNMLSKLNVIGVVANGANANTKSYALATPV